MHFLFYWQKRMIKVSWILEWESKIFWWKYPPPPVLVCQFCPRDVLTRCRKWQWQFFRNLNKIFLDFQFCIPSVSTLAWFNIMWQNMKIKTVFISASFNYALSPLLKVWWGGLAPKLVCLRRCMSCQLTRHVTPSQGIHHTPTTYKYQIKANIWTPLMKSHNMWKVIWCQR